MCILKKKTSVIAQIFGKLLTLENVVTWMPESSRCRTPFVNHRVHGCQTLKNSAWLHFCRNFTLIQKKIHWENIFAIEIWDLKALLVTRWLPITWIHLIIEISYTNTFKRHSLQNQKCFLNVFLHLWNVNKILRMLKKNSSFIAKIFWNLLMWKVSLFECQKVPVSEHPSWINVFTAPKHWWTLHGGTFFLILH